MNASPPMISMMRVISSVPAVQSRVARIAWRISRVDGRQPSESSQGCAGTAAPTFVAAVSCSLPRASRKSAAASTETLVGVTRVEWSV